MIERVRELAKGILKEDTSGHEFYHVERTYNIGMRIAEKEECDKLALGSACYLHDAFRHLEKERGLNWHVSPEAINWIRQLLRSINFPAEPLEKTLVAIELHETYSFGTQDSRKNNTEGLILQDADRLDALGAIGVARCFAFGGAHGRPMWDPEIPLPEGTYDPTNIGVSQIHHFYDKILKLKDTMNTETGRKMAEHRHRFLEHFLDEFFAE
jgi:uncharacterized protein